MEKELSVIGDILLELREAEQLEYSIGEITPLSVTIETGGLFTLICC